MLAVRAYAKAADDIDRIAAKLEPQLREAFLNAVRQLRGLINLDALTNRIEQGQLSAINNLLREAQLTSENLAPLSRTLQQAALEAGQLAAVELELPLALINQRAVDWAANYAFDLIRDINQETRQAISNVVRRGQAGEFTVRQQARLIRDTIGLTDRHALSVTNRLASFVEAGMSEQQASAAANAYAERLLRFRAENIARTETIRASNMGTQLLWEEGQKAGQLQGAKKVWIVTPDERLCPQCAPLEGKTVDVQTNFEIDVQATGFRIVSQTGEDRIEVAETKGITPWAELTPPRHPQCRCTIAIESFTQTVIPQ